MAGGDSMREIIEKIADALDYHSETFRILPESTELALREIQRSCAEWLNANPDVPVKRKRRLRR